MLTLFEMATTEGWTDTMWAMVDATRPDMQPRQNHNRSLMLFAIVIIIFFSLFIVNMFVGVIIDTFSSRQHSEEIQRTHVVYGGFGPGDTGVDE